MREIFEQNYFIRNTKRKVQLNLCSSICSRENLLNYERRVIRYCWSEL